MPTRAGVQIVRDDWTLKVGAGETATGSHQAVAGRPGAEECETLTEPRACRRRPGRKSAL